MFSTDNFRPETKRLIASVEAMYGKRVAFEYVELEPSCGGTSTVLGDGTPQVGVNVNHPHPEATAVHELIHLVLRKEGFPLFQLTNQLPSRVDKQLFSQLAVEINEAVLHRVIFHRMQQLGFRPTLPMLPLFEATVKGPHLDGFPERGAVVSYMRALLECDDPAIQARYRERYEKQGWHQLLERGQELADYLRPWSDFTKEQVVEKFIGCLNLLFRDNLVFVPGEWTTREKKGDHADRIVKYSVEPAPAK